MTLGPFTAPRTKNHYTFKATELHLKEGNLWNGHPVKVALSHQILVQLNLREMPIPGDEITIVGDERSAVCIVTFAMRLPQATFVEYDLDKVKLTSHKTRPEVIATQDEDRNLNTRVVLPNGRTPRTPTPPPPAFEDQSVGVDIEADLK